VHNKEYYETLIQNDNIIFIENNNYRYIEEVFPIIMKIENYFRSIMKIKKDTELYKQIDNILIKKNMLLVIEETYIKQIDRDLLLSKLNIKYGDKDIYSECKNNLINVKKTHTTCVKINKQTGCSFGISINGDIYIVIISKGVKYPVTKKLEFLNGDDSSDIDIDVYYGENRFCAENILLDKLNLKLNKEIKRGTGKIVIEMTLDETELTTTAVINGEKTMSKKEVRDIINISKPINIEDELKKIIDSEKVPVILECEELKYIINSYNKNDLNVKQKELIECGQYILENYILYSIEDISIFTKEIKLRMISLA
jgi:hypothetical protein